MKNKTERVAVHENLPIDVQHKNAEGNYPSGDFKRGTMIHYNQDEETHMFCTQN